MWGTLGELEWIRTYLVTQDLLERTVVIVVAAPRQDSRVKRMQTWFGLLPRLQMHVVRSSEACIPLYHECLGYGKLLLHASGFGKVADWFRQVTARPIKQR